MCRALEELREECRQEGQLSAAKWMIENGMELTKVAMGLKIEPEKIVEYIRRQELEVGKI